VGVSLAVKGEVDSKVVSRKGGSGGGEALML
jgi:hypothetical protein